MSVQICKRTRSVRDGVLTDSVGIRRKERKMKKILFITFIVFVFITPLSQASDANALLIHKELVNLSNMLSDGPATIVEESLLIKYVSLPSDKVAIESAIVLFNIEGFGGGNNYHQFLVVFSQGDREGLNPNWPFHEWRLKGFTEVGNDFVRCFSNIEVQGDNIILTGVSWKKDDAHCCPSGKAKATFRFSPYLIQEVR
jgi:hypothetical protein